MTHTGKEGREFMKGAVYANLGRPSRRVVVGPGWGLDNGMISVGGGRVMIVTVDPVSVIPAYGMKLSAWASVHLIASDYATSGSKPEYATFSYNFPPSLKEKEKEEYVSAIGSECNRLGISIVAGHTGTYPGSGFTVVGAGTMFGFSKRRGYVSPSMSKVGDAVLLTKHAAIDAVASLALCFPSYTEEKVGTKVASRARGMVWKATTVSDATEASKAGLGPRGVTSMHDATEGGILGALGEMARASQHSFEISEESLPVPREVQEVCHAFGINPLVTMGEGALVITCDPGRVKAVMEKLTRAGIDSRQVGRVGEGSGLRLRRQDGQIRRPKLGRDPYWAAYDRSVAAGLR